jgi:hypothetical protein
MNYRFYISIDAEGKQSPFMEFGIHENYKHLGNLSQGHMSKSEGVRQELDGIQEVLNDKKEVHSFGGDDWCIIDFKKEKSSVINGFDEFEPFEINSNLILKLIEDWYEFLLKWENNEISGIIHPDKRETS